MRVPGSFSTRYIGILVVDSLFAEGFLECSASTIVHCMIASAVATLGRSTARQRTTSKTLLATVNTTGRQLVESGAMRVPLAAITLRWAEGRFERSYVYPRVQEGLRG